MGFGLIIDMPPAGSRGSKDAVVEFVLMTVVLPRLSVIVICPDGATLVTEADPVAVAVPADVLGVLELEVWPGCADEVPVVREAHGLVSGGIKVDDYRQD